MGEQAPQDPELENGDGLAEIQAVKQVSKSVTCFGCKQSGHMVADCPNKPSQSYKQPRRSRTPEGARGQSPHQSQGGYPPRNRSSDRSYENNQMGGYYMPYFNPYFPPQTVAGKVVGTPTMVEVETTTKDITGVVVTIAPALLPVRGIGLQWIADDCNRVKSA